MLQVRFSSILVSVYKLSVVYVFEMSDSEQSCECRA